MPQYAYQAFTASGKLISGKLDESSRDKALKYLREQKLTPVDLKELSAVNHIDFSFSAKANVSTKDLASITRQLASLLEAGMTVDRALAMCAKLSKSQRTQKALVSIRDAVVAGVSLSEAFSLSRNLNEKRLVGMIRAAETGGFLPLGLNLLADTLDEEAEMGSFIKASLAYPMVVAFVAIISCIVLTVFIVPKFEVMLKPLGQDLPILTTCVVTVSRFVIHYWYILLTIGLFVPIIGGVLLSSESGKESIDKSKLRLTLIGPVNHAIVTSRILKTWAVMLKGGVPMIDSLLLAKEAGGNSYLSRQLNELCHNVSAGESLSGILSKTPIFPPSVAEFVAVGEESGKLPSMLERVSKVYEQEAKTKLKTLLSLLEPVTVICLAGVVLVVVMALILPTMKLNQSIM